MFQEVPASKSSLASRKLIYGIAINDADYMVRVNIDGKAIACPYYKKWYDMLRRCYSAKYQESKPTYKGCTVCKEWLSFMRFRAWMINQDWQGLELDKDIKVKGNKVYSPEACLFIPGSLNSLLTDNAARRGRYPLGVSWDKSSGKFQARINCNGKSKYLGLFTTAEEASQAYQSARRNKIQQLIDDNVYPAATRYLEQRQTCSRKIQLLLLRLLRMKSNVRAIANDS